MIWGTARGVLGQIVERIATSAAEGLLTPQPNPRAKRRQARVRELQDLQTTLPEVEQSSTESKS